MAGISDEITQPLKTLVQILCVDLLREYLWFQKHRKKLTILKNTIRKEIDIFVGTEPWRTGMAGLTLIGVQV